MRGEPGDPLHVEVVGGLVEEEDVPVADEQCGERHPPPLTAAQLREGGVPGDVRDQAGDDVPDPRVSRPDVLGGVADDHLGHRPGVAERVALSEHADAHAAPAGHASAVWGQLPREHLEQRGLAVAVAADDPDAVAVGDPDRDLVEDHASRVLEVQPFGAEEVCHCSNASRPRAGARPGPRRADAPGQLTGRLQPSGRVATAHRCDTSARLRHAREGPRPGRQSERTRAPE
ncbi:hypothetical protein GCM10025866_06370 [Naasia aerilata]|uniref:Uncharacterized protein n=1 Tax=Naasia aerilata TaxID=1162966 RepID=A0ABM8G959_9MICO|nr:hypothetical protein GCM10025866_06370 [Naasia aerilata]